MKEKGFILLGMLFMLVLIAVAAVALNRRAGLQNRMAANQARAVQTQFNQEAAIEDAIWRLTKNPCWRTSSSGEDYIFNGITYNRKVLASTVSGYTDAVTVSVTASLAAKPVKTSYRYYINTISLVKKPNQICCDTMNNIYFADSDNHSIWKIDATTGAITRVAGNGNSGFSGDGGPATSAELDAPKGVFVDSAGNIYIADTNNHRIRKVDTFDYISTVAGTGFPGPSGDGGPATSAKLNRPHGVFANTSGDIYIADTENHCIRKVDANTQIINTVAGIGGSGGFSGDGEAATSAKLKKPQGVFVNTSGEIYIADTDNNRIRKFVEGGNISTVAGNGTSGYSGDGGPATSAELDHPKGVCLNNSAEVVIADTNNGCVRQVDIINEISTFGPAVGPGLNRPAQIAIYYNVSEGKYYLFIADENNHRIRKLDTSTGSIMAVAGTGTLGFSGDTDLATNAELNHPEGVSVDTSANIYIADTENHCIRKVDANTQIINTVAGIGGSGGFSGDGGPAASAKLDKPQGVFVDASGNIYIADSNNHRIRKVDAMTQIINTIAGKASGGFSGDGGLAVNAKLRKPSGVFVDSIGNIFISDTQNNRLRVVSEHDGIMIINTLAGIGDGGFNGDAKPAVTAKLKKPSAVAMAVTRGGAKIYISDTENNRIRVLSFKRVKELY